jgi:hypothetical protein
MTAFFKVPEKGPLFSPEKRSLQNFRSTDINLNAVEYRFGTLLNMLEKEVVLRYSSTVNQEIAGDSNPKPDSLKRSAKIHPLKKYSQSEYESRLFDEISQTSRNKGEKDNFAVAPDLFFTKKQNNLIFLTDDENAVEGALKEVKNAFPLITFWNSFDTVLFLYFLGKKNFPFEMAEKAVADLHKQMLPHASQPDKNKMQEKIKQRSLYLQYLKRIRKVHQEG